ncbi:isomerase [Terrihabitans soli]|uniref:Isomerase n=1 Tax=Terrihabitans soli TaxID=708113 RepID=A0A6S6QWE0_9HYPH|nr:PhzF family phenazine biosynthesis protein [Terrihabitans soli]BCJ91371.1 isomerase [Terrihabitans soli]
MSRRFVTLDVFTAERLAGNPLAVVLDTEGLDSAAMQKIAREFNLSETVFILPPKDPVHLAFLRIFTPYRELPFAGHPTVGTAVQLAIMNGAHPGEDLNFMVEEQLGIVPCTVRIAGPENGRARFELPQLPARIESRFSNDVVAAALGLELKDIGFGLHQPRLYSAGNPFVFVPVKTLDAIGRIKPQGGFWPEAFGGVASVFSTASVFAYTPETVTSDARFHARMLDYTREDPATGSAVAAFAGVVMEFEPPPDGQHTLAVEQGYEMGRPSRIVLGLDVVKDTLTGATIGGDAVLVQEGTIAA